MFPGYSKVFVWFRWMSRSPIHGMAEATPLGPGAVKRVLSELKQLGESSARGIHIFPSVAWPNLTTPCAASSQKLLRVDRTGLVNVPKISQELKNVQRGAVRVVLLESWQEDISFWRVLLEGHPDSPFVGGIFAVDIVLPRLGDWPLVSGRCFLMLFTCSSHALHMLFMLVSHVGSSCSSWTFHALVYFGTMFAWRCVGFSLRLKPIPTRSFAITSRC